MDRKRLFTALADEEPVVLLDLLEKAYDEMMRINDIRLISATACGVLRGDRRLS